MASRFLHPLPCRHVAKLARPTSATLHPAAPLPSIQGPVWARGLCLRWQDPPSPLTGETRSLSSREQPEERGRRGGSETLCSPSLGGPAFSAFQNHMSPN